MRYISRFKNSIRASSVYSLAFMLTFALAAGLTTYEEAAAQPSVTLTVDTDTNADGVQTTITEGNGDVAGSSVSVRVTAEFSGMATLQNPATVTLSLSGSATRSTDTVNNDYSVEDNNLTFTIGAGQSTFNHTLPITPFGDDVFEGDEMIRITGATVTEINGIQTNLFTESDATITLADDDFDILLSVTAPTGGVITESSDTTSVTVQAAFDTDRVQVRGSPVTVALDIAADARYRVIGSASVEISAGQTAGTGSVMIAPVNDSSWNPDQPIKVEGRSAGFSVEGTSFTLRDDDDRPAALRLTVNDSELTENGGAQRVTVTATLVGSATFSVDKMVALAFSSPQDTEDEYKVVETDPKVAIRRGTSSGSMTITIEPVNNGIYNDDIPVTIDGSIGSDIEATAVEEVMVTIRNDDFDGTITASPLMLAEGDDETDVMVTATLPRSTQNVTRTVSLSLAGSATAEWGLYGQ